MNLVRGGKDAYRTVYRMFYDQPNYDYDCDWNDDNSNSILVGLL